MDYDILKKRRDKRPPIISLGSFQLAAGTHTSIPSTDYFLTFPDMYDIEKIKGKLKEEFPHISFKVSISDEKGRTLYFSIPSRDIDIPKLDQIIHTISRLMIKQELQYPR